MHVDGFRFDLASILGRDRRGNVLPNPPVLWEIDDRPGAGRHQADRRAVGRGRAVPGRQLRRRRAGRSGTAASATTSAASCAASRGVDAAVRRPARRQPRPLRPRAAASRSTASTSSPATTASRSTTWSPTTDKHNEANGEDNRDGADDNRSWNCGVEGPTDDPAVERAAQPAGEEPPRRHCCSRRACRCSWWATSSGRTQRGNNNAYCQDNEISWVDWDAAREERRPAPLRDAAHARGCCGTRSTSAGA